MGCNIKKSENYAILVILRNWQNRPAAVSKTKQEINI